MKRGGSSLGSIIAIGGVVVIGWLALRKMTDAQKAIVADAGVATASTNVVVPPITQGIIADAKTPVLRLDVVLRVDGIDVTADGAPACREGNKHLIGRASDGAAGSFDERALTMCITKLRAERPAAQPIGVVTRAGPAVPATYFDALVAALGRAGVADVVENR